MPNPKQQNLQCPFCAATSTRGTGLSAHIRAKHPKQYKKWNRNPNRLVEAAEAVAAPKKEAERNRRVRLMPPTAPVEPRPQPVQQLPTRSTTTQPQLGEANGNEALSLLQKAHDQLTGRKQTIETEMARIEALRNQHEAVTTQLAAIDQAMSAFRKPEETPRRQA